jgi:hypothetical protein
MKVSEKNYDDITQHIIDKILSGVKGSGDWERLRRDWYLQHEKTEKGQKKCKRPN